MAVRAQIRDNGFYVKRFSPNLCFWPMARADPVIYEVTALTGIVTHGEPQGVVSTKQFQLAGLVIAISTVNGDDEVPFVVHRECQLDT